MIGRSGHLCSQIPSQTSQRRPHQILTCRSDWSRRVAKTIGSRPSKSHRSCYSSKITDDQPVLVKQFIQGVHDYTMPLHRLLCQCCDTYGPEEEANARFYFSLIIGVREGTPENPCPEVQLHVIEDTDEDGHQLESHLQSLEIMYRKRHASG